MKNKIYILFLLAISSFSCEQKTTKYKELEKANWFLGKWEYITPFKSFTEEWKKENDSLFLSECFLVKEKDTIYAETIRLELIKNELFYIITITNQNYNKPVTFKLTSSTSDYLVFENPTHDFPKKITYKLVNKDSLYAEISGDGRIEGIPFKKVN